MHKSFSDWYRIASIEPNEESLEKRWEGVKNFVELVADDMQYGFEVVRLFHGKEPKDSAIVDRFCNLFQEADLTFPMRDNKVELQVLAGASIICCIDESLASADKLALATVCADCQQLALPTLVPEIISIAKNYLKKSSSNLRSLEMLTPVKSAKVNIDELMTNFEAGIQQNDIQVLGSAAKALFEKLSNVRVQNIVSLNKQIKVVNRSLELLREESDILWWIFAENSNDLECRMSDINSSSACIIAGKELADLTMVQPGPFSVEAFLDKMLRTVKNELPERVTLKEAIESTPMEWKEKWTDQMNVNKVEDFCPIYLAASKSVETSGDSAWTAIFEPKSSIKANSTISPLKLALQVYQESLFIKALHKIESE